MVGISVRYIFWVSRPASTAVEIRRIFSLPGVKQIIRRHLEIGEIGLQDTQVVLFAKVIAMWCFVKLFCQVGRLADRTYILLA